MITIFLRKITGKGEKLQVEPRITAAALLREVERSLKKEEGEEIWCYYRGARIEESEESIEEMGITANSIVHVVQREEEGEGEGAEEGDVVVKLIIKNKLLEYEIGGELNVEDLKETICQDLQIKQEDLTLSYLGVELVDNKTIKDYNFAQGVLLSASVSGDIPSKKFAQTYSVSRESYSEESEGIPKIVKKENPPARKKIKKAESLNVQPAFDLKGSKNLNFCSVRLNKIEEKNDESKVQSQINESSEHSQETSEVEEQPVEWQKPKMTLDLLSKPWYGDQKIIETESIVGDEDSQQTFSQCLLQLTRVDKKRRYVLQCSGQHTFQDAVKTLARLEKTEPSSIKLLICFDEVSKSGISSQSSKGIQKSPKSCESIKRQRSSHEGGRLSVPRHEGGLKGSIVQKAARTKSKVISIEYEWFRI